MNHKIRQAVLVLDLFWITAAFSCAYALRYRYFGFGSESWVSPREFVPALCSALLIWTFLYLSKNLEGFRGGWHLPTVFSQIVVAVFCLMAFLLALAFLQRHYYSRLLLLYLACLLPVGLIAIRCGARWIIASRRWRGASRRAVILGSGHLARELAYKISRHPELMLDVIGFVYPSSSEGTNGVASPNEEVLSLQSLKVHDLLREKGVQELIVVLPSASGSDAENIISKCRSEGIRVLLVPHWYELYISEAQMVEIDGVPLISLEDRNISTAALALKRSVDLLAGAFLISLLSPVLLLSIWSLKRRKKQAFVKETRCGQMGLPFAMYRLNVDRESPGSHWFEGILVALSLTELPQLWNVILGEMSLVGPRPESPERVRHYSDWQRQRLCLKPGLTGLAQVHGLREHHSSQEKARFDLEYIFHWSLFLDFSLILQTAWAISLRLIKPPRSTPIQTFESSGSEMVSIKEVLRVDRTESSAD